MSNLTLYKITNKFVELMDKAQEGELTEEEYNELGEELALQLQQKGSNIIGYAKNIELTISAMKEEDKRISDLRKSLEGKGTLSIAKNPISVEIENENEIPDKFKQEVITIKIDKTAIKNHFKETGELIPGTKIIDDKTSLRIK